jgi:hypothetical protein
VMATGIGFVAFVTAAIAERFIHGGGIRTRDLRVMRCLGPFGGLMLGDARHAEMSSVSLSSVPRLVPEGGCRLMPGMPSRGRSRRRSDPPGRSLPR